MASQRGPRLGWTLGGLGALVWLPILGCVMLAQGNKPGFLASLACLAVGLVYVVTLAPWRYPHTAFWKIYLGLAVILATSAVLLLRLWHPHELDDSRDALSLLPLVVLLIPLFTLGKKTWSQLHGEG